MIIPRSNCNCCLIYLYKFNSDRYFLLIFGFGLEGSILNESGINRYGSICAVCMHLTLTVSRISVGCLRFRAHNVEKYVSKINRHIFLANLLKARTLFEILRDISHCRFNENGRDSWANFPLNYGTPSNLVLINIPIRKPVRSY